MDPAAPQPQVIYIVQSTPRQSVRESYAARTAAVLGGLLVLGGLAVLIADIVGIVHGSAPIATGIWTSVFFIVSGGLAIGGARSGNKCLVVATLVMTVISAVSAGILLILASIQIGGEAYQCGYRYDGYGNSYSCTSTAVFGLQIGVSLALLVAAIVLASLTCRPLCCRPATAPGCVQYTPAPAPAPALASQDLPPAYHTVEGEGSKYHKFQDEMA